MKRPEPPAPVPALARLRTLLLVLAVFFVLPAALFFRLAGAGDGRRTAVMIVALTLPATGALILRLNPDLVPERAALRGLRALEWVTLAALGALLASAAWWLAGLLGG